MFHVHAKSPKTRVGLEMKTQQLNILSIGSNAVLDPVGAGSLYTIRGIFPMPMLGPNRYLTQEIYGSESKRNKNVKNEILSVQKGC